jgi:hypothetical protein
MLWLVDVGLTLTGEIAISTGAQTLAFPKNGSRDALCALIGSSVVDATGLIDEDLRLVFANGSVLTVSRLNEHPEWEVWGFVERRF